MIREGRYNKIMTIMEKRINSVSERVAKEFKNTRPFDKELVDNKQRLYEYDQIPEEQKQFGRQNFPDEYAMYEEDIEKIRRRYNA